MLDTLESLLYNFIYINIMQANAEGGVIMPDYATMYRKLFNAQTDAINILQAAQQETEQMYIDAPEPVVTVLETRPEDEKENGNQ